MDKTETRELFALLKELWPNKRPSEKTVLAWELVLKPYAYADVRAAAVAYAGKNKYFPDVADLTAGLPAPVPKQEIGRGSAEEAAWMKKYIFSDHHGLGRVSKYAREHGLTWDEAKAALAADPLEEVDWA